MAVKISIDGEGLNYNGETNLIKAAQIIAFMGTENSSLQTGSGTPHTGAITPVSLAAPQTNVAPRQLINEAEAKTNIQKIAVIAKYLKNQGRDGFVRSEIVEEFRRAGEISPKNIGRDLKDTVAIGYICEKSEQRGEYYLTNDGEVAIDAKFVSSKETKKSKPKAKKARTTTVEPTNATLKNMTFAPVVEGLPGYWKIKKSDRIHWILFVLKEQGIGEMTNKDIEYVAKMLDDNIGSGTVNAFSEVNRKLGYLAKNGTTYRVMQPGIVHLQGLLTSQTDGKESK